jgi:hypothetical protein
MPSTFLTVDDCILCSACCRLQSPQLYELAITTRGLIVNTAEDDASVISEDRRPAFDVVHDESEERGTAFLSSTLATVGSPCEAGNAAHT